MTRVLKRHRQRMEINSTIDSPSVLWHYPKRVCLLPKLFLLCWWIYKARVWRVWDMILKQHLNSTACYYFCHNYLVPLTSLEMLKRCQQHWLWSNAMHSGCLFSFFKFRYGCTACNSYTVLKLIYPEENIRLRLRSIWLLSCELLQFMYWCLLVFRGQWMNLL